MDAVTYPDALVVAAIDAHFVPLKINMLERHPDFKAASGSGRVLWGPTLVFFDARIPHAGRAPARLCTDLRITLAFQTVRTSPA